MLQPSPLTEQQVQPSAPRRPGDFSFQAMSHRLELDANRFPQSVEWHPVDLLPAWNDGHFFEITTVDGAVLGDGPGAEVLARRLADPDCVQTAVPFSYWVANDERVLDGRDPLNGAGRRMNRAMDRAFSKALLTALDAVDVDAPAWAARKLGAVDAIGALDDILMGEGIYGGAIHLPGYLMASALTEGIEPMTGNGTHVHFFPSAAGPAGRAFASPPVGHQSGARTTTGRVDTAENLQSAVAALYGLVVVDPLAWSVEVLQPADIGIAGA